VPKVKHRPGHWKGLTREQQALERQRLREAEAHAKPKRKLALHNDQGSQANLRDQRQSYAR
jgi:hypothetical protein